MFNEDGTISAGDMYMLIDNIDCGDLKLDKFGNLFYIDRSN
jgi:hypothetical protein